MTRARPSSVVSLGIGDDTAVIRPPRGHELLVTTDFSLEGTHFRGEWHSPQSVGHRCLCRGLSDIAAMGGQPLAAFLSLASPADVPQKWIDGFLSGFLALAKRTGTKLAGGDIAQSRHGILADVIVAGSVPAGKAIPRSGARSGDIIYVTGALGGSAAILRRLYAGDRRLPDPKSKSKADRKHFFPEPCLAVGRYLREQKLAHAMIDISDGLSTDLNHICKASGVGAVINELLVPLAPGAKLHDALHGGEDYELLFTASPKAKVPVEVHGVPVTEIGWVTKKKQVLISDMKAKPRKLEAEGWQHFTPSQSIP